MSDAANGTVTVVDRATSLLGQLSDRLKQTEAKVQQASTPSAAHAPAPPEGRAATERAEETLDRAGEQIGAFAASLSHRVRKSFALAREEAEDIWAEAQSLRRRDAP